MQRHVILSKPQVEKMQAGFAREAQTIVQTATTTGGNPTQALMMQYHTLVTPYCMGVGQTMFNQF